MIVKVEETCICTKVFFDEDTEYDDAINQITELCEGVCNKRILKKLKRILLHTTRVNKSGHSAKEYHIF